jgi:hypothetical protein
MSASSALAAIGIALILIAIPFGLMLAPLAIGIIVLVVALRRADRSLSRGDLGSAAADVAPFG